MKPLTTSNQPTLEEVKLLWGKDAKRLLCIGCCRYYGTNEKIPNGYCASCDNVIAKDKKKRRKNRKN